MGTIEDNSADWVTTHYLLTTMSRLVSSLMLLSLMVMVANTLPRDGRWERKTLDDPMAHNTKRVWEPNLSALMDVSYGEGHWTKEVGDFPDQALKQRRRRNILSREDCMRIMRKPQNVRVKFPACALLV